jgi:hypothetical protein
LSDDETTLVLGNKNILGGGYMKNNNEYNKYFNRNDRNENRGQRQNNNPVDEATFQNMQPADTTATVQNTNTNNFSGTSPENKPQNEFKNGTVENCPSLNLRKEPDKAAGIIKVLRVHDKLSIEGISNGWAHVHTRDGLEGYVMKEYIKVE